MKTLFPVLQKFVQEKILDPASHKDTTVLQGMHLMWQFSAHKNGYVIGKAGFPKHKVDRIATPLGNLQAMLVWVEEQTK